MSSTFSTNASSNDDKSLPETELQNENGNGYRDDLRFPDETFVEPNMLVEGMSKLLTRLKAFGLYLEPDDGDDKLRPYSDSKDNSNVAADVAARINIESTHRRVRSRIHRYYSISVLALLWVNALRFFTAFDSSDSFDGLFLNKVSSMFWMWMCAINQTSVFLAWHSGRLHCILRETLVTKEIVDQVHGKATIRFCGMVIGYLMNSFYFIYYFFVNNGTYYDFFLAPFTTVIPVEDKVILYVLRGCYCVVAFYVIAAWLQPQSLNFTLASIFSRQFRYLNERFECAIDKNTGRFSGDIRLFRRRHQFICRAVRKADRFVRIFNIAGFGCQMAMVVINLFALIFFSVPGDGSFGAALGAVFWLFLSCIGLLTASRNGIIVNVTVSI